MSQENNGQTELEIDKIITSFEKIFDIKPSDDINNILNLNENDLKTMSAEECSIAAFKLSQYGAYIQLLSNKCKARLNWSVSTLKVNFGKDILQYQAYSFEERLSQARQYNDVIRKISDLKTVAESKYNLLEGISYRVESMSKQLDGLSYSKRKINNV